MDDDISIFYEWLVSNGCQFDNIDWPSYNTISGSRGAVAKCDILPNQIMLSIPYHLMLSPPNAFKDPIIGLSLHDSKDLLTGDLLLAVYLTYEYEKGKDSFYYPYLKILPTPSTISEWSDDELKELHDDNLVLRAKRAKNRVKIMYECNVLPYRNQYSDILPKDSLTFDTFKFSWYSIQARAFGRRLPWTAMVPFADCLNHANVQTKYDYNINDNGYFRLFPTGTNTYTKGSEVFNSYGRRPNDNLLLDYGFSMLDNEWDQVLVDFPFTSTTNAENYEKKLTFLYNSGYNKDIQIKLFGDNDIPLDALCCLRIVCLNDEDIDLVQSAMDDLIKPNENIFQSKVSQLGKLRQMFENIITLENELTALQKLNQLLQSWELNHLTSLEEDERILIELNNNDVDDEMKWKKVSAVTYRLTRKRCVARVIKIVECIINSLTEKIHNNDIQVKIIDKVQRLVETFQSNFSSISVRTEKYIKHMEELIE